MEVVKYIAGFAIAIVGLLAIVTGLYLTGKMVFHMHKVVTNVTGKYASFLGALLLFMRSQFNEVGNIHRTKLLRLLPLLLLAYGIAFFSKYIMLLLENGSSF